MPPIVSVLLPNLNHRSFLDERVGSIMRQTLQDWELIVIDSYSTDGSWEFFQDVAAQDERVKISQAPKGLYQSWNRGLEQVSGQFVYIATSDDSMHETALEKMVAALNDHPECGICDSQLEMVDEAGQPIGGIEDRLFFYRYLGKLLQQKHIRRRPHDGIVYLTSNSVYTSMTQILFRKALLDQVGLFKTDWGSKCDYEWGIRAALSTDTVYLPEKLSSWCRHDGQATGRKPAKPEHQGRLAMALSAIESIEDFQYAGRSFKSRRDQLLEFLRFEAIKDQLRFEATGLARVIPALRLWLGNGNRSLKFWQEQFGKRMGKRVSTSFQEIQRFESLYGLRQLIEVLD